MTLVTTMWANIDPAIGKMRELELSEPSTFLVWLVTKGAKIAGFDGTQQSAQLIIKSQLDNAGRILTLQREKVHEGLQIAETQAGNQMDAELGRARAQVRKRFNRLRGDMEDDRRRRDEQVTVAIATMSRTSAQETADPYAANVDDIDYETAARNRYEDEMKARIQSLEEQRAGPPPAYKKQEPRSSITVPNTARPKLIMSFFWSMFTYFASLIRLLLRPRLSAGYRRLEWICVRFILIPITVLLII